MKEPIKSGDMAEVINALGRTKSQNLGLIVKVEQRVGEHSQYGIIWKCSCPDLVQYDDMGAPVKLGWADLAQSWLKKIEPPPLPSKKLEKEETV